jgi:hypothetical protein
MIAIDTELYSSPYYFLLRDKGNKYSLYFSVETTLTEARRKDEKIDFDKKHGDKVRRRLSKIAKEKKVKSTKEVKGEIEELINADGSMANSKVPILDPKLHPKKTMDQTVPASRITNDPVTRGYRVYYGESVEEVDEEDMSKAFGYQETSGKTPDQTIKILHKMGVENPVERAEEMGKDPKLNKKKIKGSDMRIRITEKETLEEIQRRKMIKVVEDILMTKKEKDSDVREKESEVPSVLLKNIKSLKKQADKHGISMSTLIKALKSE